MYYLKSRYYDPEVCRFINADAFVSTGQGILGYNMFAYCNNNPVVNADPSGHYIGHRPIMVCDGADSIISLLKTAAKYYTKEYAGFANCYAFAFNWKVDPRTGEIFHDRPQPGGFSNKNCRAALDNILDGLCNGATFNGELICETIITSVIADGKNLGFTVQRVYSADYHVADGEWLVALGFGYNLDPPDRDYHWWRRTDSGYWLHKQGDTVYAVDDANNLITDPAACYSKAYPYFIGYFVVTPTN